MLHNAAMNLYEATGEVAVPNGDNYIDTSSDAWIAKSAAEKVDGLWQNIKADDRSGKWHLA